MSNDPGGREKIEFLFVRFLKEHVASKIKIRREETSKMKLLAIDFVAWNFSIKKKKGSGKIIFMFFFTLRNFQDLNLQF